MFTGLIEETGTVKSVTRGAEATRLVISCRNVLEGIKSGDSVAVDGVCLTATGVETSGSISFDAVGNTVLKTGIKRLKKGDKVNLERAMRLGDRLGGHLVSGHVDGERLILKNANTAKGWLLQIAMGSADLMFITERGSIAVDGVSLTISDVSRASASIYLVPLTLEATTLKLKRPGDHVNVEFDMIAKYAVKNVSAGDITMDTLRQTGFF